MTREDEDKEVLAAEYVLGTLDVDDRANAQMLLAIDPGFAATVATWERRLGELNALVESVEPPKDTWEWIKVRVAGVRPSGQMWLPGVDDPPPAPPAAPAAAAADVDAEAAAAAALAAASGRTAAMAAPASAPASGGRGWRAFGIACAALAAAAVAFVAVRDVRPDLFPAAWRPVPQVVEKRVEVVRTVEVPSQKIAEYVAILQKEPAAPAFLLTLDLDRRVLSVRKVGAEPQPGRDYELWLVAQPAAAPQSLGIIGEGEFTVRRSLGAYASATLGAATFSVSVEPAGGSPTGQPTGPVVFTGKLTQTTPPAFPEATP